VQRKPLLRLGALIDIEINETHRHGTEHRYASFFLEVAGARARHRPGATKAMPPGWPDPSGAWQAIGFVSACNGSRITNTF
jgi:hypothetical protein